MAIKLNKDLQVKFKKFNSDKRARYSLLALMAIFFLTLPAEFLCNVRPTLLVVDGKPYFPILLTYSEQDFGGPLLSEPDYKSERFLRILKGESPDSSADMDLSDFDEGDDTGLILGLEDFEEDDSLMPVTETKPETIPESPVALAKPRDYWMLWPPVRYDYKYIPSHS
ncbi:MAG: peptide ABC transporter permease, partial [Nitrospinaceae bacterium]